MKLGVESVQQNDPPFGEELCEEPSKRVSKGLSRLVGFTQQFYDFRITKPSCRFVDDLLNPRAERDSPYGSIWLGCHGRDKSFKQRVRGRNRDLLDFVQIVIFRCEPENRDTLSALFGCYGSKFHSSERFVD